MIPRSAVYATSDAVLFAIALHHDELSKRFALYQPGLEAVLNILDKTKLIESARNAGIDTPETWLPKSAAEAGKIARDLGGLFLIKPRSQLSQRTLTKGAVVDGNEAQVTALFDRYLDDATYDSPFAKCNPEALTPVLQRFHQEAVDRVYSLTGFRTKSGQMVVRGARKTLQLPRKIGVGLCFEDAPVDPEFVDAAARLCQQIGYFGVFELEFIIAERRRMLIDFNGRFFNQIGLDIARGMNLPVMAHAATTATSEELARIVATDTSSEGPYKTAFCNELELNQMINMHRIFGNITREDAKGWKAWITRMEHEAVDAVHDDEDPVPTYVALARNFMNICSHPRAFIRHYGFNK
jgi:predicted ATP-grasp superfamily ATP-dependent carboligase